MTDSDVKSDEEFQGTSDDRISETSCWINLRMVECNGMAGRTKDDCYSTC